MDKFCSYEVKEVRVTQFWMKVKSYSQGYIKYFILPRLTLLYLLTINIKDDGFQIA